MRIQKPVKNNPKPRKNQFAARALRTINGHSQSMLKKGLSLYKIGPLWVWKLNMKNAVKVAIAEGFTADDVRLVVSPQMKAVVNQFPENGQPEPSSNGQYEKAPKVEKDGLFKAGVILGVYLLILLLIKLFKDVL